MPSKNEEHREQASDEIVISVEKLKKKFDGGGTPLKDLNAIVRRGDVITIIGPSGTGKSTFLRCIN